MSHREDQQIEARRVWTAPAVRRLAAGSAEDGADQTFDGAQPS
ncbi:MAG TPA: hypothetical protein VEZ20_14140 [Allosphingosinicella sp.]|nr:hypothetical protein [Allosphingosinicella sp.]